MSFLRSIAAGIGLAVAAVVPASAATFNIAFFDTGGATVGSGTFTADDVNFAPVTAFSATVLGTTYSSLSAAFGLAVVRDFPNAGDRTVTGFAFRPGETPAVNTDVLQMFAVGSGDPPSLLSIWGIATCDISVCGGTPARGTFTVTPAGSDPEPPVVPLPASAALLPLGLGTLALIRRRRARGAA